VPEHPEQFVGEDEVESSVSLNIGIL
jgi:hypothetical protein